MTRKMGWFFVAAATAILTFAIADDAQAWGRRGGSNGSNGSWGSNGGSWGSNGGSWGGRRGRRNGSWGSNGSWGGNGSHGGYSNGSCGSHGGNGGYREGEVIYGEEESAPEAPREDEGASEHEANYRGERMRDEQVRSETTFESDRQATRETDRQERVATRDSESRSSDASRSANEQQLNESRSNENAPQLSPPEQPASSREENQPST
jgi:hypothetical protein